MTTIDNKTSKQARLNDHRNALDTLNHGIILKKTQKLWVWGTILNLIRDYLIDRWQLVSIKNKWTSLRIIETDVPQGSVLGPLLFLLHIKDLELAIQECKITMFADDTSINSVNSLPNQSLYNDKNNEMKWFYANKLTVNATLFGMMSLGTGKHSAICMNQTSIEYKKSFKKLGLLLDGVLNFVEFKYWINFKENK